MPANIDRAIDSYERHRCDAWEAQEIAAEYHSAEHVDAEELLACRECGASEPEYVVFGGYCATCCNRLGLSVCDYCGEALPHSQVPARRYLGEAGRLMTEHVCSVCEEEGD